MTKKSQPEVRKDAFLKLGMGFLVLLIIANTIQLARFGEIVERVDAYNKGVVDEIGGFREDVLAFGNDMNEMRSFLLLPTKDYSFMDKETEIEPEDAQEASNTEKALYQFLGMYADERSAQENFEAARSKIAALQGDQTLQGQLAEQGMSVGPVEEGDESCSFKILAGRDALYAVIADKKENTIRVQSALGTHSLGEENMAAELAAYAVKNKELLIQTKELLEAKKTGIGNLAKNEEIKKLLSEKNIAFPGEPGEDEEGFHYAFLNSEGTTLFSVSLMRDGNYKLGDKTYEAEEQLAAALTERLQNTDASTALERMVAERRAELEVIFLEETFKEILSENGLTVDTAPREEYNKLLYDVKDREGKVAFSFVIELSSGLFKVLRDNEEIDLYSILLGSKKKP